MRERTLALLFALAIFAVYGVCFATSSTIRSAEPQYFLGYAPDLDLLRFEEEPPIPRNALFVHTHRIYVNGYAHELEAVHGSPDFSRSPEPLPARASVTLGPEVSPPVRRVADFIDEEAPTEPTLRSAAYVRIEETEGCGCTIKGSSASEMSWHLSIELDPAEDDFTPWGRMTYAIYLGESAEEAASAATPTRHLIAEYQTRIADFSQSWGFQELLEEARFLAVEALDQAGNRSARTAPIELEHVVVHAD